MAGPESNDKAGVPFDSKLVVSLAIIVALAAAAYWLVKGWQTAQPSYTRVSDAVTCDFAAGPCLQRWRGRSVALRVEPPQVPLMQPLRLIVDLEDNEASAVHVAVRGLNMDMGLNRTSLHRAGPGRWVGETILPICSQRRMEWEAAVEVDSLDRVEIPFAFSTRR